MERSWASLGQRRLVEPFAGGLAVALGLGVERALLNDINEHLINFYKWVQAGLVVEIELENSAEFYYRARERFNDLIKSNSAQSKESAELFYYLNRTGYNGLCRFNKSGLFNVPYGRYKRINYARDFLHLQDVFKGWVFESGDYSRLEIEPDDIIYADPPYDVEFTSYSKNTFGWTEQVALAEWLANKSTPVIASNQATDRILELYKDLGFEIEILSAPRRIACNGDRTPASEMLATLRLH